MSRLVQDDTNFGDHAPAVEALIDIRVGGAIEISTLDKLSAELAADFPTEQPIIQWVGSFEVNGLEAVPRPEDSGIRGFLRRDKENQSVVQIRRDGFTFSKLQPYTNWADVSVRARQLWQQYVRAARPAQISRVAVRYINHIVPPEGWSKAGDWLRVHATSPEIPGVPSEPDDFHVRISQRHPVAEYLAAITTATIKLATGRKALLFDIEVGHEGSWEANDEAAWQVLADLRDFKNDIFFGAITPQTRRILWHADDGLS